MQSIQEVSRHRQNESRHNTVSSVITDTNSSTSVVDGEISLTQQLQSINELSPTYSSMEVVFPSSAETPKHSIKLVIPVKEAPLIRLNPPLPSIIPIHRILQFLEVGNQFHQVEQSPLFRLSQSQCYLKRCLVTQLCYYSKRMFFLTLHSHHLKSLYRLRNKSVSNNKVIRIIQPITTLQS